MAFIDIYVSKSALIQSPCEAHIAHSVLLYCGYSWKTDHPERLGAVNIGQSLLTYLR